MEFLRQPSLAQTFIFNCVLLSAQVVFSGILYLVLCLGINRTVKKEIHLLKNVYSF